MSTETFRPRLRASVLACMLAAGLLMGAAVPSTAVPADSERIALGTSRDGTVITARRIGPADGRPVVVVIGEIHGNEGAGRQVVRMLPPMLRAAPSKATYWLVATMNPDGHARNSRTNAARVDLNRNFPSLWIRQGAGTGQWSGETPGSEPETRAMMAFLSRVRPDAVIVFHQPLDAVDLGYPRSHAAARVFGRWMGMEVLPIPCGGRPCHGTLTDWVDAELGAVGLTVELSTAPDQAELDRAAAASIRLGRWLAR